MARRERVVVALSGGVDSSVAAALLVEQGYEVLGLMLHLWSESGPGTENRCCTPEAVEDARNVADALGIPFRLINCTRRFREQVVDYFRNLFNGKLEREPDFIWSALVVACCDLYPEELEHDIERAYDDDLVDLFHVRMESVRDILAEGQEEALHRARQRRGGLIEDTVAEMSWWACFKKNTDAPIAAYPTTAKQPVVKGKKVGRNDPCPCGSGKKYKKCCLH